jgi:hypothetical protein
VEQVGQELEADFGGDNHGGIMPQQTPVKSSKRD